MITNFNFESICKKRLLDYLISFVRPGDLLLFLGAGDIGRFSGEFITRLKQKEERGLVQADA